MNQNEEARLLLNLAQRDLKALSGMADPEIFADEIFGFHVQQVIEKSLKAWLTCKSLRYPKTHDIFGGSGFSREDKAHYQTI